MKNYEFSSLLSDVMLKYLNELELRGLNTANALHVMRSFDSYLTVVDSKSDYIIREDYLGWSASLSTLSQSTIYQYKSIFIGFCLYLNDIGIVGYIPPRPLKAIGRHTPYIYTLDQINQIFSLADNWRDRAYPATSTALVLPCLLRLLYSTAIRIGEALDIKLGDIDFSRKAIILRQTKNRHMRFVPLNDSMSHVLKQYTHYRNSLPCKDINGDDKYLFVNLRGEKCKHADILKRFHRIIDNIKLTNPITGKPPRIHDIRHTACVHSMEKMAQKGYDLYNILPVLSKFMGHTDVVSTEYYLRLTKEIFPEIICLDKVLQYDINDIVNRALLEDYE